jgi:hypothetical protein
MTAPPLTYTIMLRSRGGADYKPAGHAQLEAAPLRGTFIAFERDGLTIRGTVDAVFIPPGCEENCIGTVFVSEG